MKRKKVVIFLVLICFIVIGGGFNGCTAKNMYSTNITWEREVAVIAEQYEMWYQLAPEETRAVMRDNIDPIFKRLDLLMDTYHNMVSQGLDTTSIILEVNRLKTALMIELVRRQANGGE
jgi:hypothetical protein